jgi:lipid-binding SYLF domain-containing protein
MKKNILITQMVVVFCLFAGSVTAPATADVTEQQILVDKAVITFQNIMKDENLVWPRENLNRVKGLLIVPSLVKGAFFIGGSGGRGVLITKDEKTGKWSQPGFYSLGSVSFGLQFGGEAAEVLMMVLTQRGLESLYTSSFKLGGDASVAAGPVGAGAKSSVTADVVSFTRSKGAFVGMSFDGSVIKTSDDWNKAYYGKAIRPTDIFIKQVVKNPAADELRRVVTRAEK